MRRASILQGRSLTEIKIYFFYSQLPCNHSWFYYLPIRILISLDALNGCRQIHEQLYFQEILRSIGMFVPSIWKQNDDHIYAIHFLCYNNLLPLSKQSGSKSTAVKPHFKPPFILFIYSGLLNKCFTRYKLYKSLEMLQKLPLLTSSTFLKKPFETLNAKECKMFT